MMYGDYCTLDTASKALGVSFTSLYKRVRREHIPTVKAGRTILVRLQDLSKPKESSNGRPS